MIIKFDEQAQLNSVNGALALRPQIEKVVDELFDKGFDGIWWIGVGGTLASAWQVEYYMRSRTKLPVYTDHAAQFLTTGNPRFTNKSVVIFSTVTGSTVEMVDMCKKAKEIGATVFGFVDKAGAKITEYCDYVITYPANEQLKFFMTANYLMYKNGEFSKYNQYNYEMEAHLASALIEIEKVATQILR